MQRLTIAAIAAFGAFLVAAPAQADHGAGTAQKKGAQCYTTSPWSNDHENSFGYWGECAQNASSVGTATTTSHRAHRPAQNHPNQ
jgi:hypothetical protein